jgi:hypothetical protein
MSGAVVQPHAALRHEPKPVEVDEVFGRPLAVSSPTRAEGTPLELPRGQARSQNLWQESAGVSRVFGDALTLLPGLGLYLC